MINITPQTDVKLLKVPLEKDSEHTLSFSNLTAQTTYFLSKTEYSFSNFTYVKEQEFICVDKPYDEICTCNYIMYRNNGFSNKYFYAFITKMEYSNENMTKIYFEIDSLQTWYFEINYHNVFIEREHVSNDTIGLHTVPENLETGEYINLGNPARSFFADETVLVMGVTIINGYNLNGQYTGVNYILFRDEPGVGKAFVALNYYKDLEMSTDEGIMCIFNAPANMFTDIVNWNYPIGNTGFHYGEITNSNINDAFFLETFGGAPRSVLGNDYVPVNNKLLCYPYRYEILTNNNGASNILKIEDFENGVPSFNVYGDLVPSCSILCIPRKYKNVEENFSESLVGAKFPIATWSNDVYTNWLTVNGINRDFANIVSETDVQIGNVAETLGLTSLDPTHISGNIINSMQEIYRHSKIPPTLNGNSNCGDVNFSMGNNNFKLYTCVIKEEYAKIIDRYFNLYGYKVNNVKQPELYSRRNYNYIKTIGCNFTGNIPQEDLQKIKNIFDSGITFWHNPENFLDYSVNNDII